MSKVKLYKYQEEAFNNTMEIYKSSNRACIIMATGTGKSYVMMRLLEEFDKEDGKAYILTPNNPTKEQTIEKMVEYNLNNAEFGLYQTINAMTDEEIAKIDCDLIIADELHRTGATQWGKKFEHLINTHPKAKVFGVTATPIRSDGRDMAEKYFDGNKACEISLSDAIVREILPMPLYVSALYTFEEEYQNMSDKIEKGNNSVEEKAELQKELFAAKQQLEKANGVPEIIKKYITNYNGKYIVFCKNKTHMKKMKGTVKKWFKQADYNGKIFSYEYYSEDKDANENFNNFQNNNQEGLKLLFVIDMLNEGLHLKDINGCILLRTTGSHIVYYQQIGRVIDAGSKEQRVILDLVSNFNSLKSFNLKKELKESVRKRQLGNFSDCSKEFELDKFDVVDLVQECIDVFNSIDEKLFNSWEAMYLKYKEYVNKYGSTLIDKENNYQLHRWCIVQRQYYNNNTLSDLRYEKLNKLNFIWNVDEYEFRNKIKIIEPYVNSDKKIKPNTVDETGFNIYEYVNSCRRQMTDDNFPQWKKEELKKIGLVPIKSREESFKRKVELFKKYYVEFNTHYIPKKCIYEGEPLGIFVQDIRRLYKKNKLSEERIQLLKEIGFQFEGSISEGLSERYKEDFISHCEELKECIKHNKKITTYTKWNGYSIGYWFRKQLARYENGDMSNEEYEIFKEIVTNYKQSA